MSIQRNYGYIKDTPDTRDVLVKFTDEHVTSFHTSRGLKVNGNSAVFDLREIVQLPQALSEIDQGSLGSCTANAISFAYAFEEIKQGNSEVFLPSRLFIYYNERVMEGTIDEDSGAQIRDGVKSINKLGVCMESICPYNVDQFTIRPSTEAYAEATLAKSVRYVGLDFSENPTVADRVQHIKRAIKSGSPVVFGFSVYEGFETQEVATTGMVPMPSPDDEPIGGHAVCAVGYDNAKQCFIVKNSWGPDWGLNGYFYMPYNYLGDPTQANDFWVIRLVTNPTNIPNFTPNDIFPVVPN